MPTSQSVMAKFITKQLVTVRRRRVVRTARMTSVLPTTVTRMMTRKTATASDLGHAMLTRYEFIEGTPNFPAPAPVAITSPPGAALVWMSSKVPSEEFELPLATVRAVDNNLEYGSMASGCSNAAMPADSSLT